MPQDEQSTNLFPINFRKRCKIVIIISHAIFSQQKNVKSVLKFLNDAAILAAAQPLKIVFVVLVVIAAKLTFTIGLLT